jgi:hypothetical protein
MLLQIIDGLVVVWLLGDYIWLPVHLVGYP